MKRIIAFTNSMDATTDVVIAKARDVEFLRFNTDEIKSDSIYFDYLGKNSLMDCDVIWHRRPFEFVKKKSTVEDVVQMQEWEEMVWNYFLQYPKEIWINYPSLNWYADRKVIQLRQAPSYNLNVPNWIISSSKNEIEKFIVSNGRCLVKPINNGFIPFEKELYHIYSTEISSKMELQYAENCPTLLQKVIEKECDVRTIYMDGDVLFFKMISSNLDIRIDEMKNVKYSKIEAPKEIEKAYCSFVKSFGLRFCTSDFVIDKSGKWFFLENNSNGNWAWLEEYFPGEVIKFFIESIRC